MKKFIVLTVFGFILYSCSPSLYKPSSKDAVVQEKLLAGRRLYVSHCGSCHNLHLPKQYTNEKWKLNIDKMQLRAKITDDEKELIYTFLISQP